MNRYQKIKYKLIKGSQKDPNRGCFFKRKKCAWKRIDSVIKNSPSRRVFLCLERSDLQVMPALRSPYNQDEIRVNLSVL